MNKFKFKKISSFRSIGKKVFYFKGRGIPYTCKLTLFERVFRTKLEVPTIEHLFTIKISFFNEPPDPLFFGLEMLFQNPTTINIERRKKYGKLYGSYFASLPIIVVGDPQIAQGVNIKEFSSFTDRNPIKFNMKYLADGFFFKNKQEWKVRLNLKDSQKETRKNCSQTTLLLDTLFNRKDER